jgi:tRNA-2-methylthio-N6-dimethylallyladenosine synthase
MDDAKTIGPATKTAFVKSYGCQMNVYDATRMEELLAAEGYGLADAAERADLVILNTCHIREKAAEKVYSELGKLKRLKAERHAEGRDFKIAVAGCVAQAEGEEIVRRQKAVDLVFGPQSYHRLPQLLKEQARTGQAIIETEFPAEDKFDALAEKSLRTKQGVAAFLTIQEGCDKFCSFCVVPYTRGSEFSRPVAQVVSEARKLAEQGVVELTLLGQNVNAYRGAGADGEQSNLARLVSELSRIDGIKRLRYMTSHPRDMTEELIEAHASNDRLMPFLHLPVQAGSDRVLKAMNRGHTAEHYLRLIGRIRQVRPDMALSGDFIVGFPGESEKDFEETLAVVRQVNYASAFSFKYSPRPGTPAAERAQVPEDVKAERLRRLQALLTEQQQAFNHAMVGKTLPILVEKKGRHEGQMIGRSPYLQSVHCELTESDLGRIVEVRITGTMPNSLSGQYVGEST